MDYPAQTPLPEAHIITSSNERNPKSLLFLVIGIIVLVLLIGGGYVAYVISGNMRLESKLKESLKNGAPVPTIGIPTPTNIPTPSPTIAPTLIPVPTSTATISATPILTPTSLY